ncbi:MAG TPA: VOC family protein [Actinomycetota bacterium]|nr:VOC family protein [Actinomycetota bacterium]
MLDHLGINVPDLAAAKGYYDVMMPVLGFEPFFISDKEFSYRPAGGKPGTVIFFYAAPDASDYSRRRVGLQHLAFRARTRPEVDAAHAKAVELGNDIIFEPQMFPKYHENYYAAFWHDPHGFMLESVCQKPEA